MYSEIAANKRKTVFLLFSFLLLIAAVALIFGTAYGDYSITIGALIGGSIYALISYFSAAKLAITMNGAKEIQKRDHPRLWRIVENLAITNGMPMPKVYIVEDQALNAFATGRDPNHAIVAATTGLLQALEDNELEGVMAHELGHIKNYDIRVSMMAFALVAAISVMADLLLRASIFGGRNSDEDSPTSSPLFIVLAIAAMILAPLIATMIQLSISRKREYLADATGALTTRHPEGLASALEKISSGGSTMRRQNPSTAHFFFANPLSKRSFSSLFSTHPPVEDRVARLRNMGDKL